MIRSLIHYWRQHLAMMLGTAVATSVLTGALLVGDSFRGSLRRLTVERLGEVTHAVVSERYFRMSLADDLASEIDAQVVPVIELMGTIENGTSGARARSVSIYAIDDRFGALFGDSNVGVDGETRRPRTIRLNEFAARAIGVGEGDPIRLAVGRPSDLHRETLFGREDAGASVEVVRLRVGRALPVGGGDRFSLEARQSLPAIGYVSLRGLQRLLSVDDRVNRLLVSAGAASPDDVTDALARVMTLADYGIRLTTGPGGLAMESRALLIGDAAVEAARHVGKKQGLDVLGILTYLANDITVGDRSIPYSTVSAIGLLSQGGGRDFEALGIPAPEGDEVFFNPWATRQLQSARHDSTTLSYYHVGPKDDLNIRTAVLRVAGRAATSDFTTDPGLTPEFPGLNDADDMASWEAPFPVDLTRIRPEDEAYWDTYAATPKAFVSLDKGLELWRSRYGALSGIRFLGAEEQDRETIERELVAGLTPGLAGMGVTTPLADGLAASSGATDFSGLFIGFSLFLIVASVVLVSLLLTLSLETRRREAGVLLATGFSARVLVRRWVGESGVVFLLGCVLGLPGAVFYCSAMMESLSTAWVAAVGTRLLSSHVTASSLAGGFLISVLMLAMTLVKGIRGFARRPARELLANGSSEEAETGSGRWRRVAVAGGSVAAFCFLASLGASDSTRAPLFFGVGAGTLVLCLALFGGWLRDTHSVGSSTAIGLGIVNAARNRSRSLLCTILVASASFVVVAVGANRNDALSLDHPGLGGFELVAESDVAIRTDLDLSETRMDLGFNTTENEALAGMETYAFRVKPGEDVSCLNLYKPRLPRILGAGQNMVRRGGFAFHAVEGDVPPNPWVLLERTRSDGAIPAFADYASATWILQIGLGDEIVVLNDRNEPTRLRIVGLLNDSMLQGELLIGEDAFVGAFPSIEGYRFFLVDTTDSSTGLLLERKLVRFGYDARPTVQRLAAYKAVENTYMTTFQGLGGLGLGLGTIGLAIVMLKNAIDRRAELALMRAVGFRRTRLSRIVLAEGVFLLVVGLGMGSLAGCVAVAPHLIETAAHLPIASLASTLAAVFIVGSLSCWLATRAALRADLVPVLKADA